jgi:glycosyltransferase involved in cell wall biosynthesis
MRIIHVINYFQPILGYQETFLAKEQIKANHDVSVITSDRYYPFPRFKETYRQLLGGRKCGKGFRIEEGIPTYRLPTLFEIRCRVWLIGLEELIVKIKPDLIISHAILSSSFRLAKLKAKGYKFKLIVDDHLDVYTKKDFIGKLYYKWRKIRTQKYLVPWVDKFVGVTTSTCQFFENETGIPKEKIEYIHLASDSDLFQFNEKKRKELRNKLKITDSAILLLYTGKINSDKGVDVLVSAFNIMNAKSKVYLLLVGDGTPELKNKLISMVKDENKRNIIFHPFVPTTELSKFYSAADICIWAKETSTSMLDAASCGRPVIGCDIPAVKERLSNGNGLTYETGNYEDLAAKISYLCMNDSLRQEMGRKGRELIEKEFSWKIISKKFTECAFT